MKNKLFPLYYCHCCKNCKYKPKEVKSVFNDSWLDKCADTNGINIMTLIPKFLYTINWCKRRKDKR